MASSPSVAFLANTEPNIDKEEPEDESFAVASPSLLNSVTNSVTKAPKTAKARQPKKQKTATSASSSNDHSSNNNPLPDPSSNYSEDFLAGGPPQHPDFPGTSVAATSSAFVRHQLLQSTLQRHHHPSTPTCQPLPSNLISQAIMPKAQSGGGRGGHHQSSAGPQQPQFASSTSLGASIHNATGNFGHGMPSIIMQQPTLQQQQHAISRQFSSGSGGNAGLDHHHHLQQQQQHQADMMQFCMPPGQNPHIVYVFPNRLANDAAAAVKHGEVPSILDFHKLHIKEERNPRSVPQQSHPMSPHGMPPSTSSGIQIKNEPQPASPLVSASSVVPSGRTSQPPRSGSLPPNSQSGNANSSGLVGPPTPSNLKREFSNPAPSPGGGPKTPHSPAAMAALLNANPASAPAAMTSNNNNNNNSSSGVPTPSSSVLLGGSANGDPSSGGMQNEPPPHGSSRKRTFQESLSAPNSNVQPCHLDPNHPRSSLPYASSSADPSPISSDPLQKMFQMTTDSLPYEPPSKQAKSPRDKLKNRDEGGGELTSEQLQHRREKLATLEKLRTTIFDKPNQATQQQQQQQGMMPAPANLNQQMAMQQSNMMEMQSYHGQQMMMMQQQQHQQSGNHLMHSGPVMVRGPNGPMLMRPGPGGSMMPASNDGSPMPQGGTIEDQMRWAQMVQEHYQGKQGENMGLMISSGPGGPPMMQQQLGPPGHSMARQQMLRGGPPPYQQVRGMMQGGQQMMGPTPGGPAGGQQFMVQQTQAAPSPAAQPNPPATTGRGRGGGRGGGRAGRGRAAAAAAAAAAANAAAPPPDPVAMQMQQQQQMPPEAIGGYPARLPNAQFLMAGSGQSFSSDEMYMMQLQQQQPRMVMGGSRRGVNSMMMQPEHMGNPGVMMMQPQQQPSTRGGRHSSRSMMPMPPQQAQQMNQLNLPGMGSDLGMMDPSCFSMDPNSDFSLQLSHGMDPLQQSDAFFDMVVPDADFLSLSQGGMGGGQKFGMQAGGDGLFGSPGGPTPPHMMKMPVNMGGPGKAQGVMMNSAFEMDFSATGGGPNVGGHGKGTNAGGGATGRGGHQHQGPPAPTVNNTFVNATMTIQQMNIQNVGGHHPPFAANMNFQQMNNHNSQQQQVMMPNINSNNNNNNNNPNYAGGGGMGMDPGMTRPYPQQQGGGGPPGQRMAPPNVQVRMNQAQAAPHYEPRMMAGQMPSGPGGGGPNGPPNEMNNMFSTLAEPLTNLDQKVPSQKLQYFPAAGANNDAANFGAPNANSNSNSGSQQGGLSQCTIQQGVTMIQGMTVQQQMRHDQAMFASSGDAMSGFVDGFDDFMSVQQTVSMQQQQQNLLKSSSAGNIQNLATSVPGVENGLSPGGFQVGGGNAESPEFRNFQQQLYSMNSSSVRRTASVSGAVHDGQDRAHF